MHIRPIMAAHPSMIATRYTNTGDPAPSRQVEPDARTGRCTGWRSCAP